MRVTTLRKWSLPLIIILILIPFGKAVPQQLTEELPLENPIYLPLVMLPHLGVEIADVWIGNEEGIALSTFLPGAPLEYIVTGINQRGTPATVEFSWSQTGPCGSGQIITKTLELDPGLWVDVTPSIAPDCIGVYTATAQITGTNITSAKSVNFQVNTASVVLSDQQGFDRCNMPSIAEMQTWWDSSPYYVAKVYLGGVSFDNTSGCTNSNINTNWMQSVADQGWTFLLAWVGPQAPCSGYTYKMSYDPTSSYQEGRDEAEAAIQAAADIGLASSIIIHYDVEGYGNENNTACRSAVDAFLQGWTERLHQLGAKSGVYGSPCNSHVSDWANINPPPDDVWIAHWLGVKYDPNATVWDVTCLSNDLWPNHQRVRQYAGDHTETWGGLPLHIDSNVLDGKVVSLAISDTVTTTVASNLEAALQQVTPQLRDLGLLSPDQGWVLVDDRLLMTQDSGGHWDDLTPQETINILDVHFLDVSNGLLIHRNENGLRLLSTSDGGAVWHNITLPLVNDEIAGASLEFNDLDTGRLVLKLSTGSIFTRIKEYATQDGGQTWQDGEILSMSVDESMPKLLTDEKNLPDGVILLDWIDQDTAWALTQQGACQGSKFPVGQKASLGGLPWQCRLQTQLWMTMDSGQSWQEITLD